MCFWAEGRPGWQGGGGSPMARLSLRTVSQTTRDWGSPWEARATERTSPPYGVGCTGPSATTAGGGASLVALLRTWNSVCPSCSGDSALPQETLLHEVQTAQQRRWTEVAYFELSTLNTSTLISQESINA